MRSHASVRRIAEWVLRAALIAALGFALWRSMRASGAIPHSRTTSASVLTRDLDAIAADPGVSTVELRVDAMPSSAERDLLVALRRSGVGVHWSGSPRALAIEVIRAREPDQRARVLVAGMGAAPTAVLDSVGLLDTVRVTAGATLDAATTVGAVRAEQGAFAARAAVPLQGVRGAVLVLGRADWESKFVMSALEEAGWVVRASIVAAPAVLVRDAAILPLDTSRYDAVVALDSTAVDLAPAIGRFVSSGGGLLVVGSAMSLPAFRAFVPAQSGARQPGRILLADDSLTPRDLPFRPLARLRSDALTLEHQPSGPALVARRAGMGRALAVGYDETWRWRMLGGASGLAAHRRWWSGAVGSVAPERSVAAAEGGNAAPLAALVSALGAPSRASAADVRPARNPLPLVLLIAISACLLAETASRRFRGER